MCVLCYKYSNNIIFEKLKLIVIVCPQNIWLFELICLNGDGRRNKNYLVSYKNRLPILLNAYIIYYKSVFPPTKE